MTRQSDADAGAADTADWIGCAYDRHAAALYRHAVMLLLDRETAADVVQQVFLALARQHRPIEDVGAYLRRAVRNEAISAWRRAAHRPEHVDPAVLEAVAGADDRPEDRLAVAQALTVLSEDQREVVHLKVFEGMTFQEIADLTAESINTVASRYRYAIDRMRAHLGAGS